MTNVTKEENIEILIDLIFNLNSHIWQMTAILDSQDKEAKNLVLCCSELILSKCLNQLGQN